MNTKYVVDTNVLVHWLFSPSGLAADIINSFMLELFALTEAIQDLFDHSSVWLRKNPNININDFARSVSRFMDIVSLPYDSDALRKAKDLMMRKDPDDIPFLAVALIKGADIWSYDAHFDNLPGISRLRSEDIRDSSFADLPQLWAWLNRLQTT